MVRRPTSSKNVAHKHAPTHTYTHTHTHRIRSIAIHRAGPCESKKCFNNLTDFYSFYQNKIEFIELWVIQDFFTTQRTNIINPMGHLITLQNIILVIK